MGRGEEGPKAECEEVRSIARGRKDVLRDLEMAITNLNEGFGLEELGD